MKRNHFYFFWRAVLLPFFKLIYRMKYVGRENVPENGAYILASNHRLATDPIMLGMGLKRQVLFMAKEELFKNKFISWFLRKLGAFPVSRGKADTGSIRHFENALENGALMGIFIEGTRSKDGEFLPPKNGCSLIAWDTKTPVIPVCHTKIGSRTVFHFGKPLSLEDMGFEKGGAREFRNASRVIMDHIKALRAEDLANYEAKSNG
ncbi:MAG: 1-acyl-sn-glycerol-3-phosphate acyltransferase [Ruminococcus sp.]|uniref:lysophospholipid acyltransferase family protein n=1 Tax=Ruminococcus sp. TaxID=41978 RepID=UPI00386A95AD|nr:1-acyl-sn-glycerol-3-phosphate acyltransferase [Ruminococcus sp.]